MLRSTDGREGLEFALFKLHTPPRPLLVWSSRIRKWENYSSSRKVNWSWSRTHGHGWGAVLSLVCRHRYYILQAVIESPSSGASVAAIQCVEKQREREQSLLGLRFLFLAKSTDTRNDDDDDGRDDDCDDCIETMFIYRDVEGKQVQSPVSIGLL